MGWLEIPGLLTTKTPADGLTFPEKQLVLVQLPVKNSQLWSPIKQF